MSVLDSRVVLKLKIVVGCDSFEFETSVPPPLPLPELIVLIRLWFEAIEQPHRLAKLNQRLLVATQKLADALDAAT